MTKVEEAQEILRSLGLPAPQQNEMSALTLLALCRIREQDDWSNATRSSMGVSKGIMAFIRDNYQRDYAANTRETFRRHVMHQFVQAGIADYNPDQPDLPVNSPNAHYSISEAALETIKQFKTDKYKKAVDKFVANVGELVKKYASARELKHVPLTLPDGRVLKLSPGAHNIVQVAIVEKFGPRFAGGGLLLYLGDTAKKNLHVDTEVLASLGIPIDKHSKLPDVVIYDPVRKWLFLIEAVTSHGPVSPKRIVEMEELLKECKAGRVYVSAFPDFSEFKRHSSSIAWETEVWIVDNPDHMIHFNGDRFIGPRGNPN